MTSTAFQLKSKITSSTSNTFNIKTFTIVVQLKYFINFWIKLEMP